jgi:hypothetical protein
MNPTQLLEQRSFRFLDSILAIAPSPPPVSTTVPMSRRYLPPPIPKLIHQSYHFAPAQPYPWISFEEACGDLNLTVNPKKLGFVPREIWSFDEIPFGGLVVSFFRKRNSAHYNFPYKLMNALFLTAKEPQFFPFVGIRWVSDSVIFVEKTIFAKLLGIRTIDGSFFHQQGNFPSHGFIELQFQEAKQLAFESGLGEIDATNMRFMRHGTGGFTKYSSETDMALLKWTHR